MHCTSVVSFEDDMTPLCRVQRKRTAGWELPENTVCVDSSTCWRNPFIVGEHGTPLKCVLLYMNLMSGYPSLLMDNVEVQIAALHYVTRNIKTLRGKNLACWCREGTSCHADVLLAIANQPRRALTTKGFNESVQRSRGRFSV